MTLREQEFYDRLAVFFDVMTDWPGRLAYEMPFIRQLIGEPVRRVLDAACGTGWHSIALAETGYEVTGADISAVMIERARANALARGADASFVQATFSDLPTIAGPGFDVVLCLGNSLVHVLDEGALGQSLAGMAGCLRPGGLLLLHNLNYDKRLAEKPRWFQVNNGEMDGRETLVWRFADYGELISFNIAVFQKNADGRWSVQVQSTPQRPWQSAQLTRGLSAAGFGDITLYGNLAGDDYQAKTSGDLVLAARRS